MQEFSGKTVVVTGGGSGIGRGIALTFAREGAEIVVADIEEPAAKAVADEITATGGVAVAQRTDVADFSSVQNLAARAREEFGHVDVLCNNAGVSHRRRGVDATHEDWLWMIGVNLWGVIHGMEAFLPAMLESGREGHIVNTSSMNGIFPSAYSAMYSTSKYGVLGLTETFRNELVGTNVGISALCPAAVSTRITESNRNRPAELAPSTPPPRHTRSSTWKISPPLDPEVVGEMVRDGIRNNQLYIFTDTLIRPLVEQHHQQMIDDLDRLAEWQRRSENLCGH